MIPDPPSKKSSVKPDMVSVTVQGEVVECRLKRDYAGGGRPRVGGGVRGDVTGFSRASRRRLQEQFNRIDKDRMRVGGATVKFITLTYGRHWSKNPRDWKRQLRVFVKRLMRRHPRVSVIWRLELQERGAPHFHLVVFGLPFVAADLLRLWWSECIGWDPSVESARWPRVEIQPVKQWNRLLYYISAYMSKVDLGDSCGPAPHARPHRDRGGSADAGSGFEGEAALSSSEAHNFPSIGRLWGVLGADSLPLAVPQRVIEVSESMFFRMRRAMRKAAEVRRKRIGGPQSMRLVYFTANAMQFLSLAKHFHSLDFPF